MTSPDLPRMVADELDRVWSGATGLPGESGGPGGGLLIALSGGPDSVALLLAARDWAAARGLPLGAAHLNHGLRGEAADRDERFCADLCARLDVPLHVAHEDPRPAARQRGRGLEEAARHLRGRFFERLLEEHPGYRAVATGHHRDDQTETVLMRLLRGSGPDGLRGIRPRQGRTLHPLLGVDRAGILAFLESRKQPWRLDETNRDGDNLRTRLRREVLPLLRELFGEGCDAAPARLAALLEDDLQMLEDLTAEALDRLTAPERGLSVPGLLDLPEALARRVLRLWLAGLRPQEHLDLERAHVVNILAWLREGTSGSVHDLPGAGRLVREFDVLRWAESAEAGSRDDLPLRSAADCRILVAGAETPADPAAHGRLEGAGTRTKDTESRQDSWNLTCPADVLQGNLRIRNWRSGDRFQPFGLDGSRKLSDLLRELRVPANRRDDVLVVEDGAGILWIVGLARSERTRLLPTTGRTVTLVVKERNR